MLNIGWLKRHVNIIIPLLIIAAVIGVITIGYKFGGFTFTGLYKGSNKQNTVTEKVKVRLRFMNWESSERATREKLELALKEFTDKYPWIEVMNISIPFYEYQEQLLRQTSDGDDPDLIQLSGYWPSLLGSKGVLEPMEGDFGSPFKSTDFYFAESLETCKYKGTLYTIPFCLNPYGLWYNKNLLKDAGINNPPKTIEELDAQLEIIKRKSEASIYGIGLDTTRTENALTLNWPFFFSFGASNILMDAQNPGFNSERAMKTMEWFKMLIKEKYTPEGISTNLLRERMAKRAIVFKVDGPGLRGVIQSLNSEFKGNLFDREFGVTQIPSVTGLQSATTMNTYSLGIPSRSKYKNEAMQLIKFLTKENGPNKNYIIPTGYIPAMRNTIDNNIVELSSSESSFSFLRNIIPVSKHIAYSSKFFDASMIINDGMQKYFSGAELRSTSMDMDIELKTLFGE